MIYLDNAATSFPKAPHVADAMCHYLNSVGAPVNRSVYSSAMEVGFQVLTLREQLARFFHFPHDPNHVIFTAGATASLNQAICGYLQSGDHCLVSATEHNAVMRPLTAIDGVTFDRIPCDEEGFLQLDALPSLLKPNTKLVVMAHASNIVGSVQNAEAMGRFCHDHGLHFVLDAAQTAGHIAVDFEKFQLSALAIPAHKGLLSAGGVGGLLLRPDFAKTLKPLIAGGTGSQSDSEQTPTYLPDRFEAGTPNLPAIYGWSAAMTYLESVGINALRAHELTLIQIFLTGLQALPQLRVLGTTDLRRRVGVISLDTGIYDNAQLSYQLEQQGILTRCGLHCTPSAHKTMGTFPQGALRFSLGHFSTKEDVYCALEALKALCV
ncbi:aminotransferase class V-fold PLP-dependent enzyme [Bengtsoniella intestinalis]|uniref:aminotransferase class V-fold PLP-dependent enzyme n=1 Tax=Bengtsoniella intestinalis TaxID=3073143 RepID=UPI00391FA06C